MIKVINHLMKCVYTREARDFVVGLVSLVCELVIDANCRLLSVVCISPAGVKPDLRVPWTNFLGSIHLPVALQVHSIFALQLIIDMLLKKL